MNPVEESGAAPDVAPLVERLFRTESGRLVALLTRLFGSEHIALAEDVTQEALLAAVHHWPLEGVPANPSGWLLRVARNRALDALRRDAAFAEREAIVARELQALADLQDAGGTHLDVFADDQLRMILLCCHPALSIDSRVALTLKLVCGFGTGEIARAFLVDESTIAQRIVRAKRTLRVADASFEMPAQSELAARLESVLDVLYLMFNEGHTAYQGDQLLREDLCQEALRLAELLLDSPATAEPRVQALAALFCFHAARLRTRADDEGALVLLAEQDRSAWDQRLISRGLLHFERSAAGPELTRYHLEAEIAAAHAIAPSWEATDWPRILAAYDCLLAQTDSPVVALNRIVAVREVRGAARALEELECDRAATTLEQSYLLHLVRGELSRAVGRDADAATAYRRALGLTRSQPVRIHITALLSMLESGQVDSAGTDSSLSEPA